tara:strand:+ start:3538 stop:3675 length:138 start_codon:yes stop_codon:yes gene_type:complete
MKDEEEIWRKAREQEAKEVFLYKVGCLTVVLTTIILITYGLIKLL